ncbi:hypothetical protein [uncultured Desulfobacter sp.]|uniref:tetratricopeptide repeat protein n=1 Tax=uncultured Desulfobacter sp. TaxID=240139 RepID=UPI0029C7A780|nr:hypothetical protein [uncultured Desulfobacter sp.]
MISKSNNSQSQNSLEIQHQIINGGKQQFADTIINYNSQLETEVISKFDINNLPDPTTTLIGRKNELIQLTDIFLNEDKRLVTIIASGGIGKSALIDEWLQQIAECNYYDKTYVFGWSFYSQGSHKTFTNSYDFFNKILPFLGISEIPKDDIEKARLLARCMQQLPCLLILDGLEPLQYPPKLPNINGELHDIALKELIACFRRIKSRSFVLISSRQPLIELKKWHPKHYSNLELDVLPEDEGAALLESLGVTGSLKERKSISKDLNGHALSLVLIGHLLSMRHQGDCRRYKDLPPLTSAYGNSDAEKDSCHAKRVLSYYDELQDSNSRHFLHLIGLFDRPMNREEKAILFSNSKHAEQLQSLTVQQLRTVEQNLEKSGLLLGKKGSLERMEWDCHPIIRSYFGRKFKDDYSENFKQAHMVLFEYYNKLPQKELPDTLEEMQPLYRAVMHGCFAGEYKKTLESIYYKRILRGEEHYSEYMLGAYSQEITALSAFFPLGWENTIKTDLTKFNIIWLLKVVSHCLVSQGRLQEAILSINSNLRQMKQIKNIAKEKADSKRILTNIYNSIGLLKDAKIIIIKALHESKINKRAKDEILNQCRLAAVLHRIGDLIGAEANFRQAEKNEQQLNNRRLYYSLSGFDYCSLLLDKAKNKNQLYEIIEKGKSSDNKEYNNPLNNAFGELTFARAYFALNKTSIAEKYFEQAIEQIQMSKRIELMPPFYLYRADFYLAQKQFEKVEADLNSAWEIIERCSMTLYGVDYLLIHGHFLIITGDFKKALDDYEEAKQFIKETNYHLRDTELNLLAAKLCQYNVNLGEHKNAVYYIQNAKYRIEEIGQWGLIRIIERDFKIFDN